MLVLLFFVLYLTCESIEWNWGTKRCSSKMMKSFKTFCNNRVNNSNLSPCSIQCSRGQPRCNIYFQIATTIYFLLDLQLIFTANWDKPQNLDASTTTTKIIVRLGKSRFFDHKYSSLGQSTNPEIKFCIENPPHFKLAERTPIITTDWSTGEFGSNN